LAALVTNGNVVVPINGDGHGEIENWSNPSESFIQAYVEFQHFREKKDGAGADKMFSPPELLNWDRMTDAEVAYAENLQGNLPTGRGQDLSNVTLIYFNPTDNGYSSPVQTFGGKVSNIEPKFFQTKAKWVEYWTKVADQHRDNPAFVVWGPDGRL
jgi:hypothetical protein